MNLILAYVVNVRHLGYTLDISQPVPLGHGKCSEPL